MKNLKDFAIVAVGEHTGEKEIVTDLYWFEENHCRGFGDGYNIFLFDSVVELANFLADDFQPSV